MEEFGGDAPKANQRFLGTDSTGLSNIGICIKTNTAQDSLG